MGGSGSKTGAGRDRDHSDWMGRLSQRVRDLPLTHLAIPGSHESGTSALSVSQGMSPDLNLGSGSSCCSSGVVQQALLGSPCLARLVTRPWSRCQDLDIRQQLQAGVRFFDIRVGKRDVGKRDIVGNRDVVGKRDVGKLDVGKRDVRKRDVVKLDVMTEERDIKGYVRARERDVVPACRCDVKEQCSCDVRDHEELGGGERFCLCDVVDGHCRCRDVSNEFSQSKESDAKAGPPTHAERESGEGRESERRERRGEVGKTEKIEKEEMEAGKIEIKEGEAEQRGVNAEGAESYKERERGDGGEANTRETEEMEAQKSGVKSSPETHATREKGETGDVEQREKKEMETENIGVQESPETHAVSERGEGGEVKKRGRGDTSETEEEGEYLYCVHGLYGASIRQCLREVGQFLREHRDEVILMEFSRFHGMQGTADLRQLNQGDVILLDQMVCQGNESVIDQCRFLGFSQQPCPIAAVGAVNCDPTVQVETRLTGGYGPWEGRLEVLRAGQWRPVCRSGFDDQDAQVVCRMLGLRNSGGKAHTEEKFSQSSLTPLIRELDCTGAESDIAQCKGTDAGTGENCLNAGVECYSCGGLFHGESGMVESENYPLSYPRNLNCLYVIRPIDEQQLYKLEFGNFSTEACCDTLQVGVLTGASNLPAGQTYSGVAMPPRLLGNAFALNFATDGSHALQGFHATWSPAVVQDVVSVSCADGHLRVDIDLTFLKRLYPLSSEATVALADPTCVGVVTASAGEDRLIITAQADQCGTKVVSDGHSIVYSNFLVDRVFDARSPLIVRQRRWDIPIHCAVVRTDDFDVLYHPVPHLNKRDTPDTNLPEAPKSSLPEAEVAHARESREVRGSLAVDLDFPVTITAFQDRTYTQVATSPLARKLGDDLDLRVEFTGGDLDLKLVLQNCQTQPELGSRVNYAIIKNGCPVDSETQVLSYNAHSTDFRFKAFEFSGDFPHIYLTCDVRVCLTNDNDAGCRQSCSSALPLVGKRSASDPIIVRESDSKVYALTFGPIVVGH